MNSKFVDFDRNLLIDSFGNTYDLSIYLVAAICYFESQIDVHSPTNAFSDWSENPSPETAKVFFRRAILEFGEGWRIWGRHFKNLGDWSGINATLINAKILSESDNLYGTVSSLIDLPRFFGPFILGERPPNLLLT